MCWAGIVLGLAFTMTNVQTFASAGSPAVVAAVARRVGAGPDGVAGAAGDPAGRAGDRAVPGAHWAVGAAREVVHAGGHVRDEHVGVVRGRIARRRSCCTRCRRWWCSSPPRRSPTCGTSSPRPWPWRTSGPVVDVTTSRGGLRAGSCSPTSCAEAREAWTPGVVVTPRGCVRSRAARVACLRGWLLRSRTRSSVVAGHERAGRVHGRPRTCTVPTATTEVTQAEPVLRRRAGRRAGRATAPSARWRSVRFVVAAVAAGAGVVEDRGQAGRLRRTSSCGWCGRRGGSWAPWCVAWSPASGGGVGG